MCDVYLMCLLILLMGFFCGIVGFRFMVFFGLIVTWLFVLFAMICWYVVALLLRACCLCMLTWFTCVGYILLGYFVI